MSSFSVFFLDIIVISVIKAYVRRRRPTDNESDMFLTVGPDKFSFPSGHASRASYISHFFISAFEASTVLTLPLLLWSTSVCVSRILLQRHHVLDVVFGFFLGIVESMFVSYFWLGQDSCSWLLSIFSSWTVESLRFQSDIASIFEVLLSHYKCCE